MPSVADGDYLGGGPVTSAPTGNVGRFFPAHFVLVPPSLVIAACTSFSYMDQPNMAIDYRLEARGAAGSVTQNYDAVLLGASAIATITPVAENGGTGVDYGGRLSGIVSPWVQGASSINTATASFSRVASPDGPFDALELGLHTTDPLNNTPLANADMNAATTGDCAADGNCNAVKIGSTKIRYGRLMVKPAFGPETRDLDVTLQTQYFDGALFAKNTLDDCTTYAPGQASLSNYSGNLSSGETTIMAAGVTTFVAGESPASMPLLLSAPGIGNDGAVDITLDVPAYLQYDWNGSGSADPSGSARFGRYRGNDRIIFWKEL